jgi:hypothetical protein
MIPSLEILKRFYATDDVFMIGYPAGIIDKKNAMPVVRKGTIATQP